MNAKSTIRKVLFISLWVSIGAVLFTLLLAAISKKNQGLCSDLLINIEAQKEQYFITNKNVENDLLKAAGGSIIGMPVTSLSLFDLEQSLKKNSWIEEAELYFDNKDALHVSVEQKKPVARIFTAGDNSFYLDTRGNKIPLAEQTTIRVPVFTGYPEMKKMKAVDSAFSKEVAAIADFITESSFWQSQVVQIDITADRQFEMVPLLGNHIVRLGNGKNIPAKFRRLQVFYDQVMAKRGFDAYRSVDVQYKGQVVASGQSEGVKVDKARYKRNVENLIKASEKVINEPAKNENPQKPEDVNSAVNKVPSGDEKESNPDDQKVPLAKDNEPGKNDKKEITTDKQKTETRVPKAVMPKRSKEEKKKED